MSENYEILIDGSVINESGKIIFFSLQRFIDDISYGNCCFICGAKPSEKPFNNEHVISDWILRKFNLGNHFISLPNKRNVNYSKLKIPCCEECNSFLGSTIEKPISNILNKDYQAFKKYTEENGVWLIFVWLNLIFLKMHLKDKIFRFENDKRQSDLKISDLYDWQSLHHIHCIARSKFTGRELDSSVLGSVLILPAIGLDENDKYDYGDYFDGKSIFIKINDICIISILNDSCGSLNLFQEELKDITKLIDLSGHFSPLQYREIFSKLSFINVNLKNRPQYYTDGLMNFKIYAELPKQVEFEDNKQFNYGSFLYRGCSEIIEKSDIPNKIEIIREIKNGNWTFLLSPK